MCFPLQQPGCRAHPQQARGALAQGLDEVLVARRIDLTACAVGWLASCCCQHGWFLGVLSKTEQKDSRFWGGSACRLVDAWF